jgi:hypothetical protein
MEGKKNYTYRIENYDGTVETGARAYGSTSMINEVVWAMFRHDRNLKRIVVKDAQGQVVLDKTDPTPPGGQINANPV